MPFASHVLTMLLKPLHIAALFLVLKNKEFLRCNIILFKARSDLLLSKGAPLTFKNRVSPVLLFSQ